MKMAEIRSNAKEFLKRLDACAIERHVDIMHGIADNLDDIRFKAVEKHMYPKERGKVKARPDKLTIRSGKLAGILRSSGSWNIPRTKAEARLRASKHLMFWVRPQITDNKAQYMARLSIVPAGDQSVEYRTRHETGRSRKGFIRPFLAPAMNENKGRFEAVMMKYNARTLIP
jgi:hypothetical protein